jgi:hypothetical protein
VLRPCPSQGLPALIQVSPGSPQTLQTIPTKGVQALPQSGIAVPDAFMMADVRLQYTPFFFNFITGSVTFAATSYWSVRSSVPGDVTTWTTLDPNAPNDPSNPNDSPAEQCT